MKVRTTQGARSAARRLWGCVAGVASAGAICSALCGCASTHAANPLDRPATDLGLIRSTAPEALLRAQAAPYAPLERCAAIRKEIASLDEVLGPDVDALQPEASISDTASAIASDLIGGFIPYRSLVRRLSGAAGRQAELERAITAGVARRGFLKGLARSRRCLRAPAPASRPR